jgi:hypothetical protein
VWRDSSVLNAKFLISNRYTDWNFAFKSILELLDFLVSFRIRSSLGRRCGVMRTSDSDTRWTH